MGQLKYHNGTSWVPVDQTASDYSALVFNDPVSGTVNGSNTVFTTTRNFASISLYLNGVKQFPGTGNDYIVTGANQVTFTVAPSTGSVITADLSTSSSYTVTGTNSFVVKQAVTGTINGTNQTFTTAAAYTPGTLEVYINGLRQGLSHVTETTPTTGTFTIADAPLTGDVVEVGYMMSSAPSGNADTTDTYHASTTPTANTIAVFDSNKLLTQDAWVSATYGTGWADYDNGASNGFGGVQYMKDSMGFVHLRGLAKNVSGSTKGATDAVTTLPVGYRPNRSMIFTVQVGGIGSARFDVSPTGTIFSQSSVANNEWVSVSPVTFKAEA